MHIGDDNKDYNLNNLKNIKISKEELLNKIKDPKQREQIGAIFDSFDDGNGVLTNDKNELTNFFAKIKTLDGNPNISGSLRDNKLNDKEISYFANEVMFNNKEIDLASKKAFLKEVLDLASTAPETSAKPQNSYNYVVPGGKKLYDLAAEIYKAQNPDAPNPTTKQKRDIVKEIISQNPKHVGYVYRNSQKVYFLREGHTIKLPVDLSSKGGQTPKVQQPNRKTTQPTKPNQNNNVKPENPGNITSTTNLNQRETAINQFKEFYPNTDFSSLEYKETKTRTSDGEKITKSFVDKSGKIVGKITVQKLDNFEEDSVITYFDSENRVIGDIVKAQDGTTNLRKITNEYLKDGTINTNICDYKNGTFQTMSINLKTRSFGASEIFIGVRFNSNDQIETYSYKITEQDINGKTFWSADNRANDKHITKSFNKNGVLSSVKIVNENDNLEIETEYHQNIKSGWSPENETLTNGKKKSFIPSITNSGQSRIPSFVEGQNFIVADKTLVPKKTVIKEKRENNVTILTTIEFDKNGKELNKNSVAYDANGNQISISNLA